MKGEDSLMFYLFQWALSAIGHELGSDRLQVHVWMSAAMGFLFCALCVAGIGALRSSAQGHATPSERADMINLAATLTTGALSGLMLWCACLAWWAGSLARKASLSFPDTPAE